MQKKKLSCGFRCQRQLHALDLLGRQVLHGDVFIVR
jgi:hypothetical protein